MKPPHLPLEDVRQCDLMMQRVIPAAYEDENGHMNVRHYLSVFDDAGYPLVERLGLTAAYHQFHGTGGFDLEHHTHYLNEVHIGDEVSVYARLLARSAKRIHYMMFMVNDTRSSLAAIFECVNSFADLTQRRTAPYPASVAATIDAVLQRHRALPWPAPICGIMSA